MPSSTSTTHKSQLALTSTVSSASTTRGLPHRQHWRSVAATAHPRQASTSTVLVLADQTAPRSNLIARNRPALFLAFGSKSSYHLAVRPPTIGVSSMPHAVSAVLGLHQPLSEPPLQLTTASRSFLHKWKIASSS